MAKKILLVEDEEYLVNIYLTKLKSEKFEVTTATSGEDGLRKALIEKPDLILLDIMLSGKLNGLDVLQKLKSENSTMNTPVLLLTNIKDEDTISEGLKLGAVGYFTKTDTTPDDIVKNIKNFI